MKTIKIYALMGVISILSIARVDAATIFVPTDGDINFASQAGTFDLAIFDTEFDLLNTPTLRLDVSNGDRVIHDNPVTQLINATASSLPFSINNGNFIIGGFTSATGWVGGVGTLSGDNIYSITFAGITGSELVIDIAAIPVPAAVWLFGSGLLGLAGVARRKASV